MHIFPTLNSVKTKVLSTLVCCMLLISTEITLSQTPAELDASQKASVDECARQIETLKSNAVFLLDSLEKRSLEINDKTYSHYSRWIDETDLLIAIILGFVTILGVALPVWAYLQHVETKKDVDKMLKNAQAKLDLIDSKEKELEKSISESVKEVNKQVEAKFEQLKSLEEVLRKKINNKVRRELDWIKDEKKTIDQQFQRLWGIEDRIDNDLGNIIKESRTEIDFLKGDYLTIKQELEKSAGRIKDSRVAYNDLYSDLINFCMNIMHTSQTSKSIHKQTKSTYTSKFDEHSLKLGLYSNTIESITASLQQLCARDEISADILIHLSHVEQQINSNYFPDKDAGEIELVLKLVDLVRSKYTILRANYLG